MNWYDPKKDKKDKEFLEHCFGYPLEPIPDEPGFYQKKEEPKQ